MEGGRCACGGKFERAEVEHFGRWGKTGRRVLVTGVPAWRCEDCGEVVFDSYVAVRLEDLVKRGEGRRMEISVAEYQAPVVDS